MVNPHQMEEGRMEVVDVNLVLFGIKTDFIGRTVNVPRLNSPTGQQNRKAMGIMITTIRNRSTGLQNGGPPELRSNHQQRLLQKAAGF